MATLGQKIADFIGDRVEWHVLVVRGSSKAVIRDS
jgi:hypothetical protein